MARFSITAMDGDSSGWAKASACDHARSRPRGAGASARAQGRRARATRASSPPGRYTVILEPAAVLDLAGQMFGDFSATAMRDGRSFLNDRIGQEAVRRQHHDPRRRLPSRCRPARPFDGEGVPRRRLTLVERGRGARDRVLPAGRRAGGSAAHRPRLPAAQRNRRSAHEHRDRGRRHLASRRWSPPPRAAFW